MKKIEIEKLLQFWGVLAFLIRDTELTADGIKMLIELRGEIDRGIFRDEFTAEYLRELHQAVHSDKLTDFDIVQDLVETVFKDLCRHLRIPRARAVFTKLREMVDAEEKVLFIRQVNVRYLDNGTKGCAVVTLVVHDYEKFQAFLQDKDDAVECVRYSDATI